MDENAAMELRRSSLSRELSLQSLDPETLSPTKDFHKELKKAEIFVNIQEKFIKKHLELKRLNRSTDMPSFIQELVAEHMAALQSEGLSP